MNRFRRYGGLFLLVALVQVFTYLSFQKLAFPYRSRQPNRRLLVRLNKLYQKLRDIDSFRKQFLDSGTPRSVFTFEAEEAILTLVEQNP